MADVGRDPFVMPDLENIPSIAQRFFDNGYRLKYDFLEREFQVTAVSGNIVEKFQNLWELGNIEWAYNILKDILYEEE